MHNLKGLVHFSMKVTALSLTLYLTACSTNATTNHVSNEGSVVRFIPGHRISLKERTIDGVIQSNWARSLTVSPGTNRVSVLYRYELNECPQFSVNCFDESQTGRCELKLNSRSQGRYRIEIDPSPERKVRYGIVDEDSGVKLDSGECKEIAENDLSNSTLSRRSTIGSF